MYITDLYNIPNIRPKQSPIPNTAVMIVLCRPENQCSLTSVGIQVMKGVAIPLIVQKVILLKRVYYNILFLLRKVCRIIIILITC